MSLRDMITFNTAVGGIQKTVQNLASIRAARAKMKSDKELHDLDVQQKKINIRKSGLELGKTEFEMKQDEELYNKFIKPELLQFDAVSGKIDIAEITEKNKLGQLTNDARQSAPGAARMASLMGLAEEGGGQDQEYSNVAENLNPNLPRISYSKKVGPYTMSWGGGRKASDAVPATDKALGALQSGGVLKEGELEPFEDKKTAEAYANQNLGIGWERKYPKARKLIDEKFPDADNFGFIKGTTKQDRRGQSWEYLGNNKWKTIK